MGSSFSFHFLVVYGSPQKLTLTLISRPGRPPPLLSLFLWIPLHFKCTFLHSSYLQLNTLKVWHRQQCVSWSLVHLCRCLWLLYIQMSFDFCYEKERFRQFMKCVHISVSLKTMFCLRRSLFIKKKKMLSKNNPTQSKKPRWLHRIAILQKLQIPYHIKATYTFTRYRK